MGVSASRRFERWCRWTLAVVLAIASCIALESGSVEAIKVPGGRRICAETGGTPGDLAMVNLTPVRADAPGYGVLTSSDVTDPPTGSNVNYAPGSTDPNFAVAPVGIDGYVCIHVSEGVEIIMDLLAILSAAAFTPTATGAPDRIADTRIQLGGATIAAAERRCFASNAAPGDVAVVNLTPARATGRGFGVLTSSDVTTPPTASNVNYAPGTLDPNVAVTSIGADGELCFHNGPTADVDLVADLLVTLDADAIASPSGPDGAPIRMVDTRIGLGLPTLDPATFDPTTSCWDTGATPGDLAIVNLTPIRAAASGYGELDDGNHHDISHVNFGPGTVDPNVAVSATGTAGQLCFQNHSVGPVDLVADALAFIRNEAASYIGPPRRILDTRIEDQITLMDCPSATRCYGIGGEPLLGGRRLYVSDDAGTTWRRAESAPTVDVFGGPSSFRCDGPTKCYLQVTYRFGGNPPPNTWVTVDGENWRKISGFSLADVECPSLDTCLAVGATDASTPRTLITTDRGRTWREIDLPPRTEPARFGSISCGATVLGAIDWSFTSCAAVLWTWTATSPVPSTVSFATDDDWRTVTVTQT